MNKLTLGVALLGGISVSTIAPAAKKNKTGKRPNILLAIADDISMESMSAYGVVNYIKTPAFDRVAREGVLFNNAYTCNPKSAPSRASLLTGKYFWQLEEAANHNGLFPAKFKTYPQILQSQGYAVGFCGKGWGPGNYQTPDNPAGPEYNNRKLKPPYEGISNKDYTTDFEDFFKAKAAGTPFCFWYGGHEAHLKWPEGVGVASGKALTAVNLPRYWPENDIIRSDMLDYSIEVEWFDKHLGQILDIIEKAGELDNTIVIVTADHGIALPRCKGQIYEHGMHIPMAVMWRGKIVPGRRIDDFINFPDIAPTIFGLLGVPVPADMSGKNMALVMLDRRLTGMIDPSNNVTWFGKERHDIGRTGEEGIDLGYPVRAIRKDNMFYVRNFKYERWPVGNPEYGFRNADDSPTKRLIVGMQYDYPVNSYYFELNFGMRPAEELYDLDKDPGCVENLAYRQEYAMTRASLWQQLKTELERQQDPRILGNGEVFDKYPYLGPRRYKYIDPFDD